MWPVHTWVAGRACRGADRRLVILAAILLKMGGYGFIRFSLPMFPERLRSIRPLVYALSVIAIIYTSLVALVQEDIRRLIAYRRSHMAS